MSLQPGAAAAGGDGDALSEFARALLPPQRVTLPLGFSDAPAVGPTSALAGSVLRLGVAGGGAPASGCVKFTVIVHAPRTLKAATFYTDAERTFASARIAAHWLARPKGKCRKMLSKLRSAEKGRRAASEEVLSVHTRFLSQLDVLSEVWRRQLRELLAVDVTDEEQADGNVGAELVQGIFPYLDAIASVSGGLLDTLRTANRGFHALANLGDAEHSSYVSRLVSHVRDQQRHSWSGGVVRLRVALSPQADANSGTSTQMAAQVTSWANRIFGADAQATSSMSGEQAAFCAELAAALRLPVSCVVVQEVKQEHVTFELHAVDTGRHGVASAWSPRKPSRAASAEGAMVAGVLDSRRSSSSSVGSGTGAALEALEAEQSAFALHRRVEALTAAIVLLPKVVEAAPPVKRPSASLLASPARSSSLSDAMDALDGCAPGVVNIARALARGNATRRIDSSAGVQLIDEAGGAKDVLAVSAATPLREIRRVGIEMDDDLGGFAASDAARQIVSSSLADRSAGTTIAGLAAALRGAKASSLADVYVQYAQFFKVFAAWSFNLESARHRIDACKKLESFQAALASCQSDPRCERADILNWLVRPNQHLMRQPMLLENLRDRTRKARPNCASVGTLELACSKMSGVVLSIDDKKQDYEQRGRLVELAEKMQGLPDHASLVMPHRQLLREGDLLEVCRTAPLDAPPPTDLGAAMSHSEATPTGGEGGGLSERLANCAVCAMVAELAPKYGFLCNDSFWYCESHRGNTFMLLHVFHFATTGADEAAPTAAGGPTSPRANTKATRSPRNSPAAPKLQTAAGKSREILEHTIDAAFTGIGLAGRSRARACAHVYPGADGTFWLTDDKMAVRLRARVAGTDDSADGAAWLAAAVRAAQTSVASLRVEEEP